MYIKKKQVKNINVCKFRAMKNRNNNEFILQSLKSNKCLEKKFKQNSKENKFNKMKIIYNLKTLKNKKNLKIDINKNNIYKKHKKNTQSLYLKNNNSIFNKASPKFSNHKTIFINNEKIFMKNFCHKILTECKNSVDEGKIKKKKKKSGTLASNVPFRLKEIKFQKKIIRRKKSKQIFNFVNI